MLNFQKKKNERESRTEKCVEMLHNASVLFKQEMILIYKYEGCVTDRFLQLQLFSESVNLQLFDYLTDNYFHHFNEAKNRLFDVEEFLRHS